MRELPAESFDRLLAGELSRSEERRLAQDALEDPELFEALTAASLAKVTLAGAQVRSRWRRPAVVLAALAAAAALVVFVRFGRRSTPSAAPPPSSPVTAAPTPVPIPPPTLLAARVDVGAASRFRAEAAPSRLPNQSGHVVHVGSDSIDLDVGSLDGLRQGSDVSVVRDGRTVARVRITAVFRERARGRTENGVSVRPGDRVEVALADHVAALLDRMAVRKASGDMTGTRELAQLAESRAQQAAMPGDILNELAIIQIDRGDLSAAERSLSSAQSVADAPTRVRVANNLGAVAALKGDRAAAERLYRLADSLAAGAPELAEDRQAIAKNLAALAPPR